MMPGKLRHRLKAVVQSPAFFWFAVALAVRLVMGLAVHLYSLESGYGGFYPLPSGHDDRKYFRQAVALLSGEDVPLLDNVYPLVLSWLFKLTGISLVAGKLLNIAAGALGVAVGVLICHRLTGKQKGLLAPVNVAGLLLAFYPSSLFYPTQLLKDPLFLLAGLLLVYLVVVMKDSPGTVWWLGFGAVLTFIYTFRPYAAVALQVSVLLFLALVWRRDFFRRYRVLVIFILVFAVAPKLGGMGFFASDYFGYLSDIDVAAFRDKVYSKGGAAIGIMLDRGSPFRFLLTYSYSFFTAFLGPFPWQVRSAVQWVAAPEAVLMLLFFPLLVRGVIALPRHRGREMFLLLAGFLLLGAVALFSDNFGANTRLRLLPWSLFFIFAAVRWGKRKAGEAGGKVLFVAAVESHILNFHLPFIREFVKKGYRVHVATRLGNRTGEFDGTGVVLHPVGFDRSPFSPRTVVALWQLVALMREHRFDLVHVHTPVGAFLGRLAALLTGTGPVLYTAHGFHFFQGAGAVNRLMYYQAEKTAARWTDGLITMNREDYGAARAFPVRRKGAVYRVNGVGLPVDKYSCDGGRRAAARERLGFGEDEVVLLLAAEFIERKNHEQALLSLRAVLREKRGVHLLLAGDGQMEGALRARAESLGIKEQVRFLGFRKDLPDVLCASDVFVLTSKHEGLPRCIMEAMAAGKPVVATDVRGSRDLVRDGVNGFLVPVDDVPATASALLRLVEDKALRLVMGGEGREMVKEYDLERVLAQMGMIYEEALAGK